MTVNFDEIRAKINNGNYPRLGSGSGRRVFDLENGYVVKVAKNKKGIAQNKMEYKISTECTTNIMAKVEQVSDDFRFLIMEKAEKVISMSDILSYYEARSFFEMLQSTDVKMLVERFGLIVNDLQRRSSWGMLDGRPVIIDYGFTKQVRARYYGFFR